MRVSEFIGRKAALTFLGATLAGGLLSATSATAAPIPASASSAAAPCGLSYSGPVFGQYRYTIRNCHGVAVDRKLDLRKLITGYPDGPCHPNIPARSSISDWISIPDSVRIAGIKPC